MELNLRFSGSAQVVVRLGDDETAALDFKNPLTEQDRKDIRWYVETYAAQPLEYDEQEAGRVKQRLSAIGKALFDAVFGDSSARRLFNQFQDRAEKSKLITLSADAPAILSLPWELLHDSSAPDGAYLFHEKISLHRRFANATKGRGMVGFTAKDRLRLLFVISRPQDASFINPRADAAAVLDALEAHGQGRVEVEFLRPASLDALLARLEQEPPVDILHFDGHGRFDETGGILKEQNQRQRGGQAELRDAGEGDGPPNTGYLLFEDSEGHKDLVSAATLGANLHRCKVGLVILSACESAALGGAEPMGSVAARLTATGIPAVLAMTHSVLVATTQKLFGEFYQHLAQGKALGASLDAARRHLANHPDKYDYWRGQDWVKLKLHDWFLPALYQGGQDVAMLTPECKIHLAPDMQDESCTPKPDEQDKSCTPRAAMLPPKPEAGFFGRSKELWDIERWFAHPKHPTRRISLTGFGGQGKTALALEAGRWLLRAGLFRAAAFVNYAETPGLDAVAVAVAALSTALGQSLPDAAAATKALRDTPTLLILDNLEILDADTLQQLLDAAKGWSEAGGSRVLLTSRRPDFNHAAYRVAGTRIHRRIQLDGLAERDALDWHEELRQLPPAPTTPAPSRKALAQLFGQVRCHPLSIRVLAAQLKTRRIAELGGRLEELLKPLTPNPSPAGGGEQKPLTPGPSSAGGGEQKPLTPNPSPAEGGELKPLSLRERGWGEGEGEGDLPAHLIASLHLSLERLSPEARATLPRLGVFQGGAFEDGLLEITGLDAAQWAALRPELEAAALIEAESLPGVNPPFLRFHPTLAPLLWLELDNAEREKLSAAHRARYQALAGYLYHEDSRNPHAAHAIARRELPNLLHAVHAALQASEPEAVDFADSVNKFLNNFGLRREQAELARLAERLAADSGSRAWFVAQSNRGEQLFASGRVGEAAALFQTLLDGLGETASYQRAQTLGRLGRCFRAGGRPDLAAQLQQNALAVLDQLQASDGVKRQRGNSLTDLADALTDLGQYPQARQAYLAGLAIDQELDDTRGQGVTLGQLGSLALQENQHEEARERYQQALSLFQTLQEPASEAIAWHQLGWVYQQTRQPEEAERCYRESARIEEALGNKSGAAATWNNLAVLNQDAGKPVAAETWYRKAIAQHRADQDSLQLARALSNLANLLRGQPGWLAEARGLAEEALALEQTLEPGVAQIWMTYGLLAKIAGQEAETAAQPDQRLQAARDWRRKAREAYRDFPGNQVLLKQYAPLILAACAACAKPKRGSWFQRLRCQPPAAANSEAAAALAEYQAQMRQAGPDWTRLADALDRLRAGERDAEALLDGLDFEDALILETILQGIADPASPAKMGVQDSSRTPP